MSYPTDRRLSTRPRWILAAWIPLLLALLATSGCSKPPEIVIPEFGSAKEQFLFAEQQRSSTLQSLVPEKRELQMKQIIRLYEVVYERYPDDKQYTAYAKLMVGMLKARTPTPENKREALELLAEVERLYPEEEMVLARALFQQGLLLDQGEQYELASAKYKETFDRFSQASDPALRDIASKARARYNKVHTRAKAAF